MAKGCWIGRVDLIDPEKYQGYIAAAATSFNKYGARFIFRGGQFEAFEGASRARNVIIKVHNCRK
jgi:uncharacterized protein (DUF1330 family)